MKNLYSIIFIFILSLNTYSSSIGKVLFVKGNSFYKDSPSSKAKKVTKGLTFPEKTSFKTNEDSIVVLSLNNGSKIKINKNSQMTVMSDKSAITSGSSFFSILKSKVRNNKKYKYQVKTKQAAMGVRGTEFFVAYGKSKDSWMCVNEGLVEVQSHSSNKKVLVKSGEGVRIDGKVSDPKALPWTKKLNWKMTGNASDLENKVSIEDAYSDPLDQDYD